ncbi:MAG: M2 family metallopeptidase [bacterium]
MQKEKQTRTLFSAVLLVVSFLSCSNPEQQKMTQEFQQFLSKFESKVIPLSRQQGLAYFQATISGKDEDYKRSAELEIELDKIYANKDDFARLKSFKESNLITDELLARQLDVLYRAYLAKQIDEARLEELVKRQNEIEQKFSTFRAQIDGKPYTDNQIEETLKTSTRSDILATAWKASKEIGVVVAQEVLDLVKLRNEVARELGFRNFHAMQLQIGEQDPEEIEHLFDELDELTRESFAKAKDEVDAYLAARYGLTKEQLMPWHYQNRFFQEAPKVYRVDLDSYYKDKDLVALTREYYASMGMPVDDVIARSDLFEKEGKYQHAYCIDIDREGDVRVVCNVKPNHSWMNTMLHECGHAVYDKFQDRQTPWLIREPAHTFATEAIAMLFGRFASSPFWMQDMLGISDAEREKIAEATSKTLKLEQLVFSRWVQVMYRFEKAMYEDPEQNLNKLWWDLVEKYQMLRRPEGRDAPDWASKIHVALYPAYYHNYMMGELFASQLFYTINEKVLQTDGALNRSFANQKAVGEYLIEKVFKPGNKFFWNDLIEQATGEKLTPKYFAKQFVR